MSSKASFVNKKIEPSIAPPKYQPPPQVNSALGVPKHFLQPRLSHPNLNVIGNDIPKYPNAPLSENTKPSHLESESSLDPVSQPFTGPPRYPPPPPVHQPLTLQRSNGPPQRLSDEELLKLGSLEMLKFVRKSENEVARSVTEQNRIARRLQTYTAEIHALKESNQRLSDDNQELRDLCCFLDDDRQKGRKLAREWQRFGRYTASVMRQEVSAYQNKLRELDNKQQELIKDNLELKELCLYLDEERSQNSTCPACGTELRPGLRDDGDGSSSSTNADEPALPSHFHRHTEGRERLMEESIHRQRSVFNDQVMQYVRNLEQRVKKLEEEKRVLQQKLGQGAELGSGWDSNVAGTSRPEAVVQALQVLEVREKLERSPHEIPDRQVHDVDTSELCDGEKALVREMCNVVWRKLEEGPAQRR